jgi:hypothetical protein
VTQGSKEERDDVGETGIRWWAWDAQGKRIWKSRSLTA